MNHPRGRLAKTKYAVLLYCGVLQWMITLSLGGFQGFNRTFSIQFCGNKWDLIQPRCGDSHSLECNLHSQAHRTRVSGSNDQGHKPFPFVDLCVDRLFFFFCVSSLIPAQGTGQICHCTNTKVDKFYRNVCIGSWTLEIGH